MVRLGNELIYSLGDSLVLVIGRKWAGFSSVCCVQTSVSKHLYDLYFLFTDNNL